MRHESFRSREDLKEKLQTFIEYDNRSYAKPVNWTYEGTGKEAKKVERPRTWHENKQTAKSERILALVA